MCPHCDNAINQVNITDINVQGAMNAWHGIKYTCAACGYILSVAIDPVALKADLREEIVNDLRRR